MTEWKLLIGTRELFGSYDHVLAVHEQLTDAGVENYVYRRDHGEFSDWVFVA